MYCCACVCVATSPESKVVCFRRLIQKRLLLAHARLFRRWSECVDARRVSSAAPGAHAQVSRKVIIYPRTE